MYKKDFTTDMRRLYSNHPKFDYFRNVNEEKLQKYIDNFNSTYNMDTYDTTSKPKLKRYYAAVMGSLNDIRLSYDEKILYVIRTCDPNLKTYYISLKYDILPSSVIESYPEDEQDELNDKNNKLKMQLREEIRNSIGFYQPELIKYEKILVKILNMKRKNKTLSTGIKKDHTRDFRKKIAEEDVDLTISDEELNSIISLADEYIKTYGTPTVNDLVYQLTVEGENFSFKSLKQKIIFIIYVIDKNFEYYKSYETAGTWANIEDEVKNILGEYNQLVMDAEIKFDKQVKKLKTWD